MNIEINRTYFGVLLFPIILVLPFPPIADSIAFALALLNIFLVGMRLKNLKLRNWSREAKYLVGIGIFILLLDSISQVLRNGEVRLIIRESRMSLFLAPVVISLAWGQIKEIWHAASKGIIIGVILYILYSYVFLFVFYETQSNRDFEMNHYLIYDLYTNLPGAYHHTYLGMYFTFTIILGLEFYRVSNKKFWLLLVLFVFFNQIFLGGKITLILSAFYLTTFFIKRSVVKTKGRFFYLLILLLALLVSTYYVIRTDLWKTVSFSFENRLASWACSWQIFLGNWMAGIGEGGIKEQLAQCVESEILSSHNQYLEDLVHYGLLGLWLPLFFFFLLSFARGNRIYSQFLIMIIILALSENILSLQRGILFFAFYNTVLYFYNLNEKDSCLSSDHST